MQKVGAWESGQVRKGEGERERERKRPQRNNECRISPRTVPAGVNTPSHGGSSLRNVTESLTVSVDKQPVVLVAEDRDEDLFMIRRAFEQLGYHTPVQYVREGEQAIAYLAGEGRFANREEHPLPDLLLLDLKMPRKNGFEVLEWIKGQPGLEALRTVVLTTSDDIFEVNRAYKLGASSFLTKPLNLTEFRDTIQAVHNYWLALNRPANVQRPQKGRVVPPPLQAGAGGQ